MSGALGARMRCSALGRLEWRRRRAVVGALAAARNILAYLAREMGLLSPGDVLYHRHLDGKVGRSRLKCAHKCVPTIVYVLLLALRYWVVLIKFTAME